MAEGETTYRYLLCVRKRRACWHPGRGRQGPEFLERSGGGAIALGAISHHVLPAGVRDVEPVRTDLLALSAEVIA
jgi:hypothetical protein